MAIPFGLAEPQYFHVGMEILERKYIKQEELSAAQIDAIGNFEKLDFQTVDNIAIIPIHGVLANHFSMVEKLSIGGTSPSQIKEPIVPYP